MKSVQISDELFKSLLEYFFSESSPSDHQSDFIRQQLNAKLDKLISRELFTNYKRAASLEERERYRKEYLKHIGVSSGFISEMEIKY